MPEFELPRVIHDPIHGNVRVTKEEMEVVNHPLFLRLHHIHQTSLLYYVWPGATQTRFAHSLGVMQMADTLLGAVNRQSRAVASKLWGLTEAQPGQAVRFHELESENRNAWLALRRAVRFTALVHDLGHGPLSHCFNAAPSTQEMRPLLADTRLAAVRELIEAHLGQRDVPHVDHEVISCVLFAYICAERGIDPWVPCVVTAVLLNRPISELNQKGGWQLDEIVPGLAPFIPFIRDLVSSAPIDADRMDYLHRDSAASGVAYGMHDRERLLKSVLCVRDQDPDRGYRLGWKKSGLRAIESFVFARFQMFVQHYYHKTNHAVMVMLRILATMVDDAQFALVGIGTLDELVTGYRDLSDESLLRVLASSSDARIAALARQIQTRCLWKRVYEFDRDESAFADEFAEAMCRKFPNARLILDRMPLKATKDLDRGAYLLELDSNRMYHRRPHGATWLQASPILGTLRDDEQLVVRLFVAVSETDTEASITELKKAALSLAHDSRFHQEHQDDDRLMGGWR